MNFVWGFYLEYVHSDFSQNTSQGNKFVGKVVAKQECEQCRHDLIVKPQVGN